MGLKTCCEATVFVVFLKLLFKVVQNQQGLDGYIATRRLLLFSILKAPNRESDARATGM